MEISATIYNQIGLHMISCKIFLSSLKLAPDSAPAFFQELIIKELKAQEDPNITIITPHKIIPDECYIEISCLKKPDLTHQKLQNLAIKIDETARRYFQIEAPIRIRIIQIEEDSIYGIN
ncbi:hypothetical protein [Microbulbifer sp. JMSA003]|uniref:hypothetical protein n=1 Tax=Microbulbifer sp. JMSA003 TaxID=3243369 RepID=UPI00403A5771